MSDIAIEAHDLSKRYRIGERERYYTLRDSLARVFVAPLRWLRKGEQLSAAAHVSALAPAAPASNREPQSEFIWALKDISFEIRRGEMVGIIGRNGAGKSTLLKILSRITEPTAGEARIRGRVGSLLEVGTGFHPELTGRENIYLNGAILGMKKSEIESKFDEIVSFAEIEKFLDTAVKHYSSGMYMRLAFSVAAHLEPDILLVDEVLAVGDVAFQKKCLGKMEDVAKEGRTVLFVSHNMAAIKNLCQKCILLEAGSISMEGDCDETIERYLANVRGLELPELSSRVDREGNGMIRFSSVRFCGRNGRAASTFLSGENCEIKLLYRMEKQLSVAANIVVAVGVYDICGDCLFLCSNELTNEIARGWPESGEVSCNITRLPLASGNYKINVFAAVNGEIADWVIDAAVFEVQNADFFGTGRMPPPSHGRFLVSHSWSLIDKNMTYLNPLEELH
jgi:lipopolysaccharide transport system ATP-binding protein